MSGSESEDEPPRKREKVLKLKGGPWSANMLDTKREGTKRLLGPEFGGWVRTLLTGEKNDYQVDFQINCTRP